MATNILLWILLGVGIFALFALFIALIYLIFILKAFSKTTQKINYLVEDITHKSEMLNATVETISKVSNYLNAFDVVVKKQWTSAIKLLVKNKDHFAKVTTQIQELMKKMKHNT